MSYAPIAYTIPQYENYPNYWMKAYNQGTTTPKTGGMATDSTGGTTAAKYELNANGFPVTAGAALIIPYINGSYDLWLFPTEAEADANDTSSAIQIADNILGATPYQPENTPRLAATTAALVALANPVVGQVAETAEFSTDNGGGATYDAVLTSSGTPNAYDFLQSTADPLISWKYRREGVLNAKQYGATGDGVTDDTVALQAFLDAAGDINLPDGTYITDPLNMASNTTLTFGSSAILKAKAGYGASDRLLNLNGVSNVTIYGNYGIVRMITAEYTTGEDRHCVNMYGVENVTIYDLVTEDSGGDGFYVGNIVCKNVALINCFADNHRRNGLSITNAQNMLVLGGHYKNTGTASVGSNGPWAGIDIESNLLDDYYLENINIIGVKTSGNTGSGILVTPQSKFHPVSITLEDCTSYDDGSVVRGKGGISVSSAMAYIPATDPSLIGKISGKVSVINCSILNPKAQGFSSVNWTENAPTTVVKNLYVLNPYSGAEASPSNRHKSGVHIRGETPSSGLYGSSVGNMIIDGVRVEDDRTTPLMYIPIYVELADESDKPLKDLTINDIDVTSGQWTYGSGDIPFASTGSLAKTNVAFDYKNGFEYAGTVSTVPVNNNYIGLTLINTANINYTLPDASLFIGSTFNFEHTTSGNFQITPSTGDTLLQYGLEAGSGIISRSLGSIMSIKAVSANEWRVVKESGGWAIRTGYEPRYPFTYDSAAPTSGTWTRRDMLWNYLPSASGTIGWVCVASGTFSAASDVTGDTDGSTAVITGLTDTSDFFVGNFVTVSAGMPSASTPYKITALTASTMTLDTASTSAQANVTIVTVDPVFKTFGAISA
jgi:hypothetical protein